MVGLLEIRRRKLQFTLIAAVFGLIAYLVLMITGLGIGLNELAGSAILNLDADRIAYADNAGRSVIRSEMSQETVDRIAAADGVEAAAPLAYVAASYEQAGGTVGSAAMLGYDAGTIAEPLVVAGRALAPDELDGALADKRFLRESDLAVGDTIAIRLRLQTTELRIVGEVDEGAFFFQPALYILRPTLLDLKYGDLPAGDRPAASVVLIRGAPVSDVQAGYEVIDKQTAFENIEGVAGQSATIVSLQVFGYLIGAMVIGVFFYVLTLQKVGQIGMLKAIGASNGFVVRQLLAQVSVIASAGLAVSIGMAVLTERALQGDAEVVPISFSTTSLVTTCAALLLTAVIGVLFSGRQVLGADPIIALGQQQ